MSNCEINLKTLIQQLLLPSDPTNNHYKCNGNFFHPTHQLSKCISTLGPQLTIYYVINWCSFVFGLFQRSKKQCNQRKTHLQLKKGGALKTLLMCLCLYWKQKYVKWLRILIETICILFRPAYSTDMPKQTWALNYKVSSGENQTHNSTNKASEWRLHCMNNVQQRHR